MKEIFLHGKYITTESSERERERNTSEIFRGKLHKDCLLVSKVEVLRP